MKYPSRFVTMLLGLVFGTWLAMLYLGRGVEAAFWYVLEIACALLLLVAAVTGLITPPVLPVSFSTILLVAVGILRLAGLVRLASLSVTVDERPWFSRWPWLAGAVAASLLLAVVPGMFGVRAYTLPSASMAPGLVAGDNVLTWPASPAELRRGDVIIFSVGETGQIHIKRVVGLPGDEVQVIGGTVHLNGEAVSLTPAGTFIQAGDGRSVDRLVETLPGGVASYYVLDIDPKGMGDSTPVFKVAAGEFFVMGDHRDNSMDSRFSQIGPVSAGAVEGWLWLVYWNDAGQPLTGRTPD